MTQEEWLELRHQNKAQHLILSKDVDPYHGPTYTTPTKEKYPQLPKDCYVAGVDPYYEEDSIKFASRLEDPTIFPDVKLPKLPNNFVSFEED